jgi:hypothetical protein
MIETHLARLAERAAYCDGDSAPGAGTCLGRATYQLDVRWTGLSGDGQSLTGLFCDQCAPLDE